MLSVVDQFNDDILVLSISGKLADGKVAIIFRKSLELIALHNAKNVIFDKSMLDGRMLRTEFYAILEMYYPFIPDINLAVIENLEYKDLAGFQENVFQQCGKKRVKYFFDRQEAIGWLKTLDAV